VQLQTPLSSRFLEHCINNGNSLVPIIIGNRRQDRHGNENALVHEKNLFPAKKGCRQLQLPVLTAAAAAAALSLVFVLFLLLQVGRCQVREMHARSLGENPMLQAIGLSAGLRGKSAAHLLLLLLLLLLLGARAARCLVKNKWRTTKTLRAPRFRLAPSEHNAGVSARIGRQCSSFIAPPVSFARANPAAGRDAVAVLG